MIASPIGKDFVSLSQSVDISQFATCTAIKFELSFKYFYRNYAPDFSPAQFFIVTINKPNFPWSTLHTEYVTLPGSPRSTGNEYVRHKSEFIVSTGINAQTLSKLRVSFTELSVVRLRVGIDDVELTGRCHNF